MRFYSYDKKDNLVTFANSFINYYGLKPNHETIKEIDDLLETKRPKKIVCILMDGMGKTIADSAFHKNSFIESNNEMTISSVFPPTTAAATTAFLNGKYPAETGYLGWTFRDPNSTRVIETFTRRNYITKEYEEFDYDKEFPETTFINDISNQYPQINARKIMPASLDYDGYIDESMEDFFNKIGYELNTSDECFLYAYNLNPDKNLHKYGLRSTIVRRFLIDFQNSLETFTKEHDDTLFFLFADHSHVAISQIYLEKYKDFNETYIGSFSIDSRTCSFFVKEGKSDEFVECYKKYFATDFDLITKQEAIDMNLFGKSKDDDYQKYLGDFILISVTNKAFVPNGASHFLMKASHSGGTKEENLINLYTFNK